MVIIKEGNMPALLWLIDRIMSTYPGPDSKVRVVDVKASGICRRPMHRLAPSAGLTIADKETGSLQATGKSTRATQI